MNKKDWEVYIYGLDVAPRGTKLVNFKAVALCLAYHSDWRTLEGMSASMVTIAKETGIGRTTVTKIVAEMLKLGFLVKREEKRIWTKNIWTHIYDLTIPSQEVQLSEHPRLSEEGQDVQVSEHPERDANQDVQNGGQDVQFEGQDVQNEGQDVQLSEHNHTNNHTKDHTSNHTSNHAVQDGDENRGCDGNEPTGTQTASQQSSDLTKKGEDMNPSSDSKTNTARSLDSKTNAAEKTALKAPSSDSKTNTAEKTIGNANASLGLEDEHSLDLKTGSAESDSKEESQSETSWLIFKAPKTELCQHDKIGFCRKCDTADLADLQDAVSLL